MIDVTNVRNFNRTEYELQEFAVFTVCVAGKTADVTARKVESFLLSHAVKNMTPFQAIRMLHVAGDLVDWLKIYRFGQYNRISKALTTLSYLPHLNSLSLEVLQDAMGPKSARFFLMNTRPNQLVAALDTHILAELREEFPLEKWIPKSTPAWGPMYRRLEQLWLDLCNGRGVDSAEEDLRVWIKRSRILERNKNV